MNGFEPAFHRAVEHDVSGGRDDTAPDWEVFLDRPALARVLHVPPAELATMATRPRLHFDFCANVRRAGDVVRLEALPVHAQIVVRDVDKPRSWRIRGWIPVLRAGCSRANVANSAIELWFFLGIHDQTAALEVHALGRIRVGEGLGRKDFAVGAVDHIEVRIALRPDENLPLLTFPFHVQQNDLVDAVPVVNVVRRELVKPSSLAGVGIAGEYSRSPLVVAWTLLMIPGARVRGAVINKVQLRIV